MARNHLKIYKGVFLTPQTGAPTSPADGDMYYDSSLAKFRFYQNGTWSLLGTGSLSGPVSSTDHAIATWNGTAGTTLQDTGVTIDASNQTDIKSGLVTLKLGADSGAATRTDATAKSALIGAAHYTNAQAPMGMLYANTTSSTNDLYVGGGTSSFNAATKILFYTSSTNTSLTGSELARFDSNALRIGTTTDLVGTGPEKVTVINTSTDNTQAVRGVVARATLNSNSASAAAINAIRGDGYRQATGSVSETSQISGGVFKATIDVGSNTYTNTGVFVAGIQIQSLTLVGSPTLAISNYAGIYITADSVASGTRKTGIQINTMSGATNNAQIADNSSFTGSYFLHSTSLLPSNMNGPLVVGSSNGFTGTQYLLRATTSGTSPLTGVSQYGIFSDATFTSASTTEGHAFFGKVQTTNASYTTALATSFYAETAVKGASNTITRLVNYYGLNQTAGTNNAFLADNATFTGSWFLNSTSTNASLLSGPLELKQQATPSNPASGNNRLYFKSDNVLYSLTSAGVESAIGSGTGTVTGPGSSTDRAIATWNSTTGTILRDSGVIIDASNNITFTGKWGNNGAVGASAMMKVNGNTLGGVNQYAIEASTFTGTSAATSAIASFVSGATTAAAAFTVAQRIQFYADTNIAKGAGSTITRDYGIFINGSPTQGTNNVQISDNNTFSGNYVLNFSNSNPSRLNGKLGILSDAGTTDIVMIGNQSATANGVITTSTQNGLGVDFTASSAATAFVRGIRSFVRTENASFTTGVVANFLADTISKGASNTITRSIQYELTGALTVGTNNAGISDNETFSGNWFINSTNTNGSRLSGQLLIGRSTASASKFGIIIGSGTSSENIGFGQTSQFGMVVAMTVDSAATGTVRGYQSQIGTDAASFTLPDLQHFYYRNATVGAGSTITRNLVFGAESPTMATSNVVLGDNIAFSGNWFINNTSTNPSLFSGVMEWKQSATPSNPASGNNRIYFKSDGNLYKLSSSGTETVFSTGGGSGDINNGGNSFGSAITIGTNDGFGLNFETNNVTYMTISASGDFSYSAITRAHTWSGTDWNFTGNDTSNGQRFFIENTSTASGSHSRLDINVQASTSGDAYQRFRAVTPASNWSMGLKNSDNDNFYINASSTLSSTNLVFKASFTNYDVTIGGNQAFVIDATNATPVKYSRSVSGSNLTFLMENLSNTASSDSRVLINVGGTSAGDAYIGFQVPGATNYALGIDNSDGDKLKLSQSSVLGTSDVWEVDANGSFRTSQGAIFGAAITDLDQTNTVVKIGGSGANSNLTGTSQEGVQVTFTSSSASTTSTVGITSAPRTANVSYTTGFRAAFHASNLAKGAASTITRDIGIRISTPDQGTNNAYVSDNISFSGDWGLSLTNTRKNLIGGILGVGASTADVAVYAAVGNVVFNSATQLYGFLSDGRFPATATDTGFGYVSSVTTNASAYTLGKLYGFYAQNPAKGAGSTITRQIQFGGVVPTQGANNAFLAENASFSGDWFINQSTGENATTALSSKLVGKLAVGGALDATCVVNVTGSSILSTTNQRGVASQLASDSTGTDSVVGFYSSVTNQAGSYTTALRSQIYLENPTKGAGTTITRDVGISIAPANDGTNNANITDNATFTGDFNLCFTNTKDNSFAGRMGIGTGTSLNAGVALRITGTPITASGGSDGYGVLSDITYGSSVTNIAYGTFSQIQTANASFTTTQAYAYWAQTAVKGASNTITRLVNFGGVNQTAGTNNAFLADNATFTGNFFISQTGTATSSFGGNVTLNQAFSTAGYDTSTPTTGGTVTASANKPGVLITPAGTLATLTIKLPSSPIDGQKYWVASSQQLTAVTWQDSGGTAGNVIGGQTTIGGTNRGQSFVYSLANTKWYAKD